MNVTRDVVRDLMPAFYSGEASADTRALIEDYFRQDSTFALEAQNVAKVFKSLGEDVGAEPILEQVALKRAKRLLLKQKIVFAVASTFALNAISLQFSFEIKNGAVRVHWLTLPGQLATVAGLVAVSVVFWGWYYLITRRVRIRILG